MRADPRIHLVCKKQRQISELVAFSHPRNLIHTDSSAVTPISPAAQKFHVLFFAAYWIVQSPYLIRPCSA